MTNANAARGPALCVSAPAIAAPNAAPLDEDVSNHENASVSVPAGAAASTIA
jgi:hypothetical protein